MKARQGIPESRSIKNEIRAYILANFLPGDDDRSLRDDDLLFESGIIDSAGAGTLIAFFEERFKIQVLDEELFPENFASVVHIVDFLVGKLKAQ